MAAVWPQSGPSLAVTWPQLGRSLAAPGRGLAASWLQPGCNLAAAWPQRGRSVAVAWPQLGRCVALAWPQFGRAWPLLGEGTKKPQEPQEAPRGQSVFVGNLVFQSVFVGVRFVAFIVYIGFAGARLHWPKWARPD